MKKLTYFALAAAALLFAASCQQENNTGLADGELVDVAFQVAMEGQQTKSYSDGTTATVLTAGYSLASSEIVNISSSPSLMPSIITICVCMVMLAAASSFNTEKSSALRGFLHIFRFSSGVKQCTEMYNGDKESRLILSRSSSVKLESVT